MSKPKLSGAARRKLQREQQAIERDRALGVLGVERPDVLTQYQTLPPPPTDPIGRVTWAQHALSLLLWETLTDPSLCAADRRRVGGDLAAKIGITTNKAVSEARIKAVEERLGMTEKPTDADTEDRPAARPPALRG